MNDLPRIGAVDLDGVVLIEEPRLGESEEFQENLHRLESGAQVVDSLRQRGELPLDKLLTQALDELVGHSGLTGMMISSEDGFPIAQSSGMEQSEILAAIGCLFQLTVRRTQKEGVVAQVEEMAIRGFGGEQVVVRFFPGLERRYFLVAYSCQPCAHRRATSRALKYCGDLLRFASGETPRNGKGVGPFRQSTKQQSKKGSDQGYGESNETGRPEHDSGEPVGIER